MLDGYLTAIVIRPCSIPPDEWLAAILAVAARFNVIGENLSITPRNHVPIFERMDGGTVLAGPWCMGLLAAMQLRLAAWLPLRDLARIEHGLLLPILLHCNDASGGPLLGPPREGRETEDFLRTAYHDIPLVVPEIRDFWMPQRLKES